MKTKKPKTLPKATAPADSAANTLSVKADPAITVERRMADFAVEGTVGNASVLRDFCKGNLGELHISDCLAALRASVDTVRGGDLGSAEAMLTAQAVALNSIFVELARRSALNMGQYIEASECYMRLALKAQGQCRATLETLAEIKNPPVVFARQANINNGGHQQVNNGYPAATVPGTRAQETAIEPNKLLEPAHGERMDGRAQGSTGRTNQDLEAVGAINRTKVRGR